MKDYEDLTDEQKLELANRMLNEGVLDKLNQVDVSDEKHRDIFFRAVSTRFPFEAGQKVKWKHPMFSKSFADFLNSDMYFYRYTPLAAPLNTGGVIEEVDCLILCGFHPQTKQPLVYGANSDYLMPFDV